MKYYTEQANCVIKENDFNSLVQNYDFVLKNEEIRYVKLLAANKNKKNKYNIFLKIIFEFI